MRVDFNVDTDINFLIQLNREELLKKMKSE